MRTMKIYYQAFISVWFGLAVAGCGDGNSNSDSVSSLAEPLSARNPGLGSEQPSSSERSLIPAQLPDSQLLGSTNTGSAGGPSPSACDDPGGGMGLSEFQALAGTTSARCVSAITPDQCESELQYAYSKQLITCEAFRWGRSNGYYPAVDRANRISAVCKCGCFEKNTSILTTEDGRQTQWTPADQIRQDSKLAALDEKSSLSHPRLKAKPIKALTSGSERPALYAFELDNGRILKVTQHHGMLLANGRVVEAHTLSVGSKMLALDGKVVRVIAISRETTDDSVYNFEVDTSYKTGHIIAAEGILIGDLAWQNQLARELGSIALRR